MVNSGKNILRLERWFSTMLSGPLAPAAGVRVALCPTGTGDNEHPLLEFEVSEPPDQEAIRELVDKVDQQAQEDAESGDWNSHPYIVYAYDRQDGKVVGTIRLLYSGTALATERAGHAASGQATNRDQVALSMQQTDNAYTTLIRGFGMVFDNINRQSMRTEAVLDKMTQSMARTYELMEQASERRFERETLAAAKKQEAEALLKREEAKIEHDRHLLQAGIDSLGPIIPILANRFLSKNGDSGLATSRDALMASLLSSMTSEQEQALRSTLSDAQMVTLVEIADSLTNLSANTTKRDNVTKHANTTKHGNVTKIDDVTKSDVTKTDDLTRIDDVTKSDDLTKIDDVTRIDDVAKQGNAPKPAESPRTVTDHVKAMGARVEEAVDYLRVTLLSWAIDRLQNGEPVDPRGHSEHAAKLFGFLLECLAKDEFGKLVSDDSPFAPIERKAFMAMAEAMKKPAPL